jgi:hypothetical protein
MTAICRSRSARFTTVPVQYSLPGIPDKHARWYKYSYSTTLSSHGFMPGNLVMPFRKESLKIISCTLRGTHFGTCAGALDMSTTGLPLGLIGDSKFRHSRSSPCCILSRRSKSPLLTRNFWCHPLSRSSWKRRRRSPEATKALHAEKKVSGMTHVRTSPFYMQSNGKGTNHKVECIRPRRCRKELALRGGPN